MKLNRLKGQIFYLAGSIQYLDDLGVEWREYAQQELYKLGAGVLNPTNKACNFANEDKDQQDAMKRMLKLARESNKFEDKQVRDKCHEAIHSSMKAIWRADLRMVDLASALLVRIDPTVHTAGTYDEVTRARMQCKPIIMFCDKQDIYDIPLWFWGGNYKMFFNSLEESLDYIRHIDQDEKIEHHKQWKFFDHDKVFGVK